MKNWRRQAGVVLPLFSVRTREDWGIGQITDLVACASWIRRAAHTLLQVLPPHELTGDETSPYGARTAFGLDPIYITLELVEDLDATTIAEVLGDEGRRSPERVRASDRVLYKDVRAPKGRVLRAAFERFYERQWLRNLPGSVGDHHWVYRLPAPIEDLERDPNVEAQMRATRALVVDTGRLSEHGR